MLPFRYPQVRTIDRVWKIKNIFKTPKHEEKLTRKELTEVESPISSYFNDPYVLYELNKIKETFQFAANMKQNRCLIA